MNHWLPNKQKSRTLIDGYVRETQQFVKTNIIPQEISHICHQFYYLGEMEISFKANEYCIIDLNNQIFTTKGAACAARTYCIIEREWSKHTNNGIHKIKLKCLKSARNRIRIGIVTNNKTKMASVYSGLFNLPSVSSGLFNSKECEISYQLQVNNLGTYIQHFKKGKEQYNKTIPNRKPISNKWKCNSYGPNETMEMKIDLNKCEVQYFINDKQIGNNIKIKSNIYYPAIAYDVRNKYG
eukprot:209644_1